MYVFLICSFQNHCHHILNQTVGVSQPVDSCGFFVSKHHPPSLSEKKNQATTSCPGLTPELEAPHGTTFQVLEGSTNWMLPTMSLWYHRAGLRKNTSFQRIFTDLQNPSETAIPHKGHRKCRAKK